MPTYKRPDALRDTLTSLVALDYPPSLREVIVVDDGPDAATAAVIEEIDPGDLRVSYLPQQNSGVATARNAGASHAAGELLIFLDDDMLVEPDHVQRHLAAHADTPDCLVNGHWEFAPAVRTELERTPFGRFRMRTEDWVKQGIDKEPVADGRLRPTTVTAANLSISASLFDALGGFDNTFPFAGCEDQEFSFRAQAAGCSFLYDPKIRLYHNDERVTLEQFCARQERGALTFVYLVARHPEAYGNRALLLENAPISRYDPIRLRIKKLAKLGLSSRLATVLIRGSSRLVERVAPQSRLLERLYTIAIGTAIFRGVRAGIDQLPSTAETARAVMRARQSSLPSNTATT